MRRKMGRVRPWFGYVLLLVSVSLNLMQFQWSHYKEISDADIADGCVPRYAVIMDAGSTGSRIHVYEFIMTGVGHITLRDELFEGLKPGLSAFAQSPQNGALSLTPLLDSAIARIPSKLQAGTILQLGATAGLRMLPGNQSDVILHKVRGLMRDKYPFQFTSSKVDILSGDKEGEFAWIALNYLVGKLGRPPSQTVGVIDLGGGSVQMMRALDAENVAEAPADGYIFPTEGGAQWGGGYYYNLYVHSWLGFGLMAVRMKVLQEAGAAAACMPNGYEGKYTYKGLSVEASAAEDPKAGNFDKCIAKILKVMRLGKAYCPSDKNRVGVNKGATNLRAVGGASTCSFDGTWSGGVSGDTGSFHLVSYLYERVLQAKAGTFEPNEGMGTTTAGDIKFQGGKACKVAYHALTEMAASSAAGAGVHATFEPELGQEAFFCLDIAYIYALLSRGFLISDHTVLSLMKKVYHRGKRVEATWSLGAAISSI